MAKRYRKIAHSSPYYRQGEVYDDNYKAEGAEPIEFLAKTYPEDWQLVEDEEFVLPEKWYIRITEENRDTLIGWVKSKPDWDADFNKFKLDYFVVSSHPGDGSYQAYSENINESRCYQYSQITYEQFKKYVLKEERGEIIGYKLKEDFEKFREAANSIVEKATGSDSPYLIKETRDIPLIGSNTVQYLKEAGVLDLWFEPVYGAKLPLPEINGYDGKVDGDMVKYGCAAFKVGKLKDLINCHGLSGCRYIKSIKLSSGVEMTIDEIKQIVEYFDSL